MYRVALALLLVSPAVADAKPPKLVEFESPDGRFKVEAAGKPDVETTNLKYGPNADQTIPRTLVKWHVPGSSTTITSVTFADYPDGFKDVPAATLLDAARDGLRGPPGLGGTVEADKPFDFKTADGKSITGREVTIKARKNWIRARLVMVDTRLYEVMVTGHEDAVTGSSAKAFLDSFKLVK